MKLPARTLVALTLLLPATAPLPAQTAREIIDEAVERHEARVAGIDDYTIVQEMNGAEQVAYYEKRMVEGRPVFVRQSPADLALRRSGLGWPQLQQLLTGAFSQAGLGMVASDLEGASEDQLATLVGSMGQRLAGADKGDVAGAAKDALMTAGTDAVKDALVDAAVDAGLQALASGLGGAAGPVVATVVQALRDADGFGDALGNLAGALPDLAGSAMPGGGRGAVGPMGANLPDQRSMALSAAASAGLGTLAGMGTRAIAGVLRGEEEGATDPYAVLRRIAGRAERVSTETRDGHPVWVLEARDPDGIDVAGDDFAPTAITFHMDRDTYVLRHISMEGPMEVDGERRTVTVSVRLEDYREVDGLLHPFRTVTTFEGMGELASAEERAEMSEQMAEMRRQMAEMKEQLEQMPPEQRRMVEQQLERMGGLSGMQAQAEGGMAAAAEGRMELVVREIRVNQGPPKETTGPGP